MAGARATAALIRSERCARQTPAGPPGCPSLVLTWADGGALLAVLVWGVSFPVLKGIMTVVAPQIYANMESFFAVLAAALLLGEQVAVTSIAGGAAVVPTRRPE